MSIRDDIVSTKEAIKDLTYQRILKFERTSDQFRANKLIDHNLESPA